MIWGDGPQDKEDEDFDDILPDTNIDRERTLTGKCAILVFVVASVFVTLAFVTPNWIEGDPRFYGTKVERFGLWVHCLRSLPDYTDITHQRFYAGCRWLFNPFTEGYDRMRPYLAPCNNNTFFFEIFIRFLKSTVGEIGMCSRGNLYTYNFLNSYRSQMIRQVIMVYIIQEYSLSVSQIFKFPNLY